MGVFASIPSPGSNSISIGPLEIRAYGLLIATGVLVAVWLAQKRLEARGGDPNTVVRIAYWAVPAGIVGARLYHVITDNQKFRGNWLEAFQVWQGGLGIWGGVAGGAAGAYYVTRRDELDFAMFVDASAPALAIAQAIGRFGNWFNQELFGRPTDVPWALEIDPPHRPAGFEQFDTFHPTFLYEAVWTLTLAAFLIFVVPRLWPRLRAGRLFLIYVIGYTVGRVWIELLRIDPANEIAGLRVNVWTSIVVCGGAILTLIFPRTPREGSHTQDGERALA